jgi:uncharacterized SAM-binding protein YcdF (DUF218 family)
MRLWKTAVTLLAAGGLLLGTVMFTPLVPWWARKLGGSWDDPSGEVLIVLGGSNLEDGILGMSSYWRCVYAVRAYRQAGFARVVVSGGGPSRPAIAMRDFLNAQGVPADRIELEDQSTNTHENALFVKKLLSGTPGRKVLLTSDYHMFRARRAFAKAGISVLPRPFPDVIKRSSSLPERWPLFVDLCAETAKSAYYWARGWI